MAGMDRRRALRLMATAPIAAAFTWTDAEASRAWGFARAARDRAARRGAGYEPEFFTPHEWETVRVLVDLIIPADDRSGSATDAGVPEFMDFMMIDRPRRQATMREGLAWFDEEARRRFGRAYVDCGPEQRTAILDDIAWPDRAPDGYEDAVAFFNGFRDLTASGFWSSEMGVEDLRYLGNTFVAEWTGCPPAALEKLGVSYDDERT